MDIVEHLCSKLKISRLTLGIAGLKDKKAVTRQRISIYKSALKKMGGEQVFLDALAEIAAVLKINRHSHPIGMSTPITNTFYIRLRAEKNLGLEEKKAAKLRLQELFE